MRQDAFIRAASLGLVLAMTAVARANIGDTLDELRLHYGSAKNMGSEMLFEVRLKEGRILPARDSTDTQNHFTVTVYFDGIHSGMEVFTRNTSDPSKAAMTPGDIATLLTAISGGTPWLPVQPRNGKLTWVWGDRKGPPQLLARYDGSTSGKADDASVLVIMQYAEK